MTSEITSEQLDSACISHDGILEDSSYVGDWSEKLEELYTDPTIMLVRTLFVAPILASGWTVQEETNAPKGLKDFIEKEFFPHRRSLMKCAALGCADWGWSPFEKIFRQKNNRWGIKKFKSLLQSLSEIRVDEETGAFRGLTQEATGDQIEDKILKTPKALVFNFDVRGTNWYGNSIMKTAVKPHDDSIVVSDAANRYDKKISGTHWVIEYPRGKTKVDGEVIDNFVLAQRMMSELKSSCGIIVPTSVKSVADEFNEDITDEQLKWVIDLKEAGGSAAGAFNERNAYLDKLKVRAWGFPERSILEGQFGTKAEAGEHGDFALTSVELRHYELVENLNKHAVNQIIRINVGKEHQDSVKIVPNSLTNEKRDIAWKIYDKFLANPELMMQEFDLVDMKNLRELLDIPSKNSSKKDKKLIKKMLKTLGK